MLAFSPVPDPALNPTCLQKGCPGAIAYGVMERKGPQRYILLEVGISDYFSSLLRISRELVQV